MELFDHFILRTPAKSIEDINLNNEDEIRYTMSDPQVLDAIFYASPNFYSKCKEYLSGNIHDQKEIQGIWATFSKYYSRMCSRTTPFGKFAGVTLGTFADESNIEISRNNKPTIRFDFQLMKNISDSLIQLEEVKRNINYYPNNSLFFKDEEYRYIEFQNIKDQETPKLVKVDHNEVLQSIIEFASSGKSLIDLIEKVKTFGFEEEEIEGYLDTLIESQILIPDIYVPITGDSNLDFILDKLKGIQSKVTSTSEEFNAHLDRLEQLEKEIQSLQSENISEDKKALFEELIQPYIDLNKSKHYFQCDMHQEATICKLSKEVKQDLLKALEVLAKLSQPKAMQMEHFRKQFSERYGNHEVNLLEALDNESGIGYQNMHAGNIYSGLLDGLSLATRLGARETTEVPNKDFEYLIHILDALKQGKKEINLKLKDEDSKVDYSSFQSSFNSMVKIGQDEKGQLQYLIKSIGGSSGLGLIGRFLHLDKELENYGEAISDFENEKSEGKIQAEIVHLSSSRIGNIQARPVLRAHEISYLGVSGAKSENQIQAEDLFVSIKNNRVVLRSKKHNKEVVPKMASAHNYSLSTLPVYRFLCDLQHQGNIIGANFHLGHFEKYYNYIPRISYNQFILQRATWMISKEKMEPIIKASDENLLEEFKKFVDKEDLPRVFYLADGDNELYVNTENFLSASSFINLIKKRNGFKIIEAVFDQSNALTKNNEGKALENEFIFTFKNTSRIERPSILNSDKSVEVTQNFPPGSEWIYYNLYCSNTKGDQIVESVFGPLVENLKESNLISNWFFIRYGDEKGHHLRFRVKLTGQNHFAQVLSLLNTSFRENADLIDSYDISTYERELDRYGYQSIEDCEMLFDYDSTLLQNLFPVIQSDENRWKYAMGMMNAYMELLDMNMDQKLAFAENSRDNFRNEFGFNKTIKDEINKKFKDFRNEVYQFFETPNEIDQFIRGNIDNWKDQVKNSQAFQNLKKELEAEELEKMLWSFIHMSVNRTFNSKQRTYEFVLYEFISKEYKKLKFAKPKVEVEA